MEPTAEDWEALAREDMAEHGFDLHEELVEVPVEDEEDPEPPTEPSLDGFIHIFFVRHPVFDGSTT